MNNTKRKMQCKEAQKRFREKHSDELKRKARQKYYEKKHIKDKRSIEELKEDWGEYDELMLKCYLSRPDIKRKIYKIGEELVIKEYLILKHSGKARIH